MSHFRWIALALALVSATAWGQVQMALIVDASSSTEEELPTFRAGVANSIATLRTDGAVELSLVQFSAEALVLVDAVLIDSVAARDAAVAAAMTIDPALTDVPPFQGGTNFEDAFIEATAAMTGSARFGTAAYQWINMLTDGNPTAHNHFTLEDIDDTVRRQRARMFGLQARDDALAMGVDLISFEALGAPDDPPAGIPYLETLTAPGEPFFVTGIPPVFPQPFQSQGFILEIATVEGIQAAMTSKFAAATIPEPLSAALLALGACGLLRRRR